jgi:hypothetical protein
MINKYNGNEIISTFIGRNEFPKTGLDWVEFVGRAQTPSEEKQFNGLELLFKLKVTDCTEKIVSKEDIASICNDTEDISYTEEVLKGETEIDNALLQCWRHKKMTSSSSSSPSSVANNKAVLWIIGRNDCFMHPHVAKRLYLDQGFDVYVLNWSSNGMCRKRGWLVSFCCHIISARTMIIENYFRVFVQHDGERTPVLYFSNVFIPTFYTLHAIFFVCFRKILFSTRITILGTLTCTFLRSMRPYLSSKIIPTKHFLGMHIQLELLS